MNKSILPGAIAIGLTSACSNSNQPGLARPQPMKVRTASKKRIP
jgi:hypothetical protein